MSERGRSARVVSAHKPGETLGQDWAGQVGALGVH